MRTPTKSGRRTIDGIRYSKRGVAYLPGESTAEFHRRRTKEQMGSIAPPPAQNERATFKPPPGLPPLTRNKTATSSVSTGSNTAAPPLLSPQRPTTVTTTTLPNADIADLQSKLRQLQTTLEEERQQRRVLASKIAILEAENAQLKALPARQSTPTSVPSVQAGSVAAATAELPTASLLPPTAELEAMLLKVVCKVFGVAPPSAMDTSTGPLAPTGVSLQHRSSAPTSSKTSPATVPAKLDSKAGAVPQNSRNSQKKKGKRAQKTTKAQTNSESTSSTRHTPTTGLATQQSLSVPAPLATPTITYADIARRTTSNEFQEVRNRKRPTRSTTAVQGTPALQPKRNPSNSLSKPMPPRRRPNSILVLPAAAGSDALVSIQQARINPRTFNITQHTRFPSGAVLLICGSTEKAEALRTALQAIPEIRLKAEKKPGFSFRIHYIPEDTTEEEFVGDFERRFPNETVLFKFVPYTEPKAGTRQVGSKLAYCEVSEATFHLAEKTRTLRVGWSSCPIDTKPFVSRCTKCGLLGHNKNHCQPPVNMQTDSMEESAPVTGTCHDCSNFNTRIRNAQLGKRRLRDVHHPTGDKSCPTYRRLLGKKMPTTTPKSTPPASSTSTVTATPMMLEDDTPDQP